jgi:hypothetical protein
MDDYEIRVENYWFWQFVGPFHLRTATLSCVRVDMHAVGVMNKNDRLYLTKAALARAAGLDPRSKDIKELEPDAHLVTTQNKRVARTHPLWPTH